MPKLLPSPSKQRHSGDCGDCPVEDRGLELGSWVRPGDDLEAEWQAVRRSLQLDEFAKVQQFRDLVQSKGLDRHLACTADGAQPHTRQASTLLRFLRARGGNLEAAATMLEGALNWRRDFDLDVKLRAWRAEWAAGVSARVRLIRAYTYIAEIGLDNLGLPVMLHRHSVADLGGMVREVGQEPLLLYMVSMIEGSFERARARMLATGDCVVCFIEIHDVGNYGMVGSYLGRGFGAAGFFKTYAPVFDSVYPERVRVCFVVRMPAAFAAIWRLFSAIIPPETKKKLRLNGYSASGWMDEMKQLLPMDVIPEFLRSDAQQLLQTALPWGGLVPKGAIVRFEHAAEN